MPVETSLEEIQKVILSSLIARPNSTPLPVLDRDYYEMVGGRIPWRTFGYGSLLEFLQSMPQYFHIENINGTTCVRGIADKSKHVSSLVARQKMSKSSSSRYRSYNTYMARSRPKISAEKLNNLVRYVKNSPNGVSMNTALQMMQNQLRYITLSRYDLQDQLRELSHQLYLDGEIIRPVIERNITAPQARQCYSSSAISESSFNKSKSPSSNVVYTVPEECSDTTDINESGFVRPNTHHLTQSKTDERFMSNLMEYSNYRETDSYYSNNQEDKHDNVDNAKYSTNLNVSENESDDLSNLISHRMQSRLRQLVQKYSEGIPCSELPDLYMKEFKMPLNYNELGFNSVCNFVSYLPDIFYLVRLNTNDDFIVYSVDKKSKEQDVTVNSQGTLNNPAQVLMLKTKPIDIPNSQHDLDNTNDDNAPFPLDLSPGILDKFAPADAATFDDINYILVSDLQQDKKQYQEIYIIEVFTPSFFWIHLRKNVMHLKELMKDLHEFYQQNYERYTIPKLALKRGLNCACIYDGTWHRAVIKTVKPDFRVNVMFYDYGTQKTYEAGDVFYLTKQFSQLPAQAIPCGLYDVKPYAGDRWKKSINDRFVDRISETLLAATVASIDPLNNSMLIILTDTSEEEDVRINDWLVQENLARKGKVDCVDMASLTKYVYNSSNRLPAYCFAEENPIIDSCNKSTITEEHVKSLKVSGSSITCSDNNQQQRSVPPGFIPINAKHIDRFNTQTNRPYVCSAVESITSTKTPSLNDLTEDLMNNLLLDENSNPSMANVTSDIFSNVVEQQMFAQFMEENTTLQMSLTNSFRHLLKFPPETKNACLNYITLLFQFNNTLKILVKELDNRLLKIIPNLPQNYENDATLSLKTSHYNPNCDNSVNQGPASLSKSPPSSTISSSSTTNSFGEYHKRHHHATVFPISDIKDLLCRPQYRAHARNSCNSQPQAYTHNFEQAANQVAVSLHQTDINDPCVRSHSTTSGVESLISQGYGNIPKDTSSLKNSSGMKTPSLFNGLSKNDETNLLADINSKSITATLSSTLSDIVSDDAEKQMLQQSYINISNVNPSSRHHIVNEFANTCLQHGDTRKDEEPTKQMRTNPFLVYQNVEEQIPEEQNTHYNYITNFASCMSSTRPQQSYVPAMDGNAKSRAMNYNFHENNVRSELNVDSMPTEYGMYGNSKVNSGSNYEPKIVYEAGPIMYDLKTPKEQQLPLQSATQLQNDIVNNDVDQIAPSSSLIDSSVLNNESYITSTTQVNNSPVLTNMGNQYQLNVNANVLSQHVLPEPRISSIIQNNDPSQVYSEKTVSITACPPTSLLPYNKCNYETNKEHTIENICKTVEQNHADLSDDNERAMMATCANFWNFSLTSEHKGMSYICNTTLNKSFLFQRIDIVDGIKMLFHMDESGWILIDEFVKVFSKYSESCCLEMLLEATNVSVPLKEVHRFEYPVQFSQLDSYFLNVARDLKNHIISLNLISLQAALGLLYRLKLILREEIEIAFKRNKTFSKNPVMIKIWALITTYKNFRHRIEQCNADYKFLQEV